MGRGREAGLDLVLGHKAHAACPPRRRVVENVVHLEAVPVLARERVELLLHEDVLLVHVRVDEAQRGAVGGVLERGVDDLVHGRDAATACDHAEGAGEARSVLEVTLRALDTDVVAKAQERKVARDVAFLVRLATQEMSRQ